MKFQRLVTALSFRIFLTGAAVCVPAAAHAQGTFPPADSPATPVMKTLDQIQPRKPVSGGTGFRIVSTPGSYYLTGNLSLSATTTISGITISASDVDLDLGGFTLSTPGNPAILASAIRIGANCRNVTIHNGKISYFANGVSLEAGSSAAIGLQGLTITNCYSTGILFKGAAPGSIIGSCAIVRTGGSTAGSILVSGISTQGGVRIEKSTLDTGIAIGARSTTGMSLASGDFAIGNTVSNFTAGIIYGTYRNNLFSNCITTVSGGTDAGGNN